MSTKMWLISSQISTSQMLLPQVRWFFEFCCRHNVRYIFIVWKLGRSCTCWTHANPNVSESIGSNICPKEIRNVATSDDQQVSLSKQQQFKLAMNRNTTFYSWWVMNSYFLKFWSLHKSEDCLWLICSLADWILNWCFELISQALTRWF